MHTLISRQRAVNELLERTLPMGVRSVSPMDALGLTAAQAVKALCHVPENACSVRDGYAVRADEVGAAKPLDPVRLSVGACIRAESSDPDGLKSGEAARVLTGGPVPPGADAVVAEEDVEIDGDAILVREPLRKGWFVRAVGGEIEEGTVIAQAGETITPQSAAIMTRTRVDSLLVHPRPHVRIMALGSELAAPGCEERGPARFPADNLVLTRGLFEAAGAVIDETGVMPDDETRLVRTLSAPDLPEVVVTTGGTGNSERDFAQQAAEESGFTPIFSRIEFRPGRNMFAAVRGSTLLFCLPGPPAAVHACFHAIILPVLRRLRGLPDRKEPLRARFTEALSTRPGSEWLVQCELALTGATLTATPFAGKDVPPMYGLGRAHGVAVLQGGQTVTPDDEIEILTTRF